MIFSVTEKQVWKRCRRMWQLTSDSQENLAPIVNSPNLQLGGMVQLCLSQWTLEPATDPIKFWAQIVSNTLEEAQSLYESHIGAPMSDVELNMLYEVVELGTAMVSNYRDYYISPLPEGYKLARPEERFVVSIPNTEHYECPVCNSYMGLGDTKRSTCFHDNTQYSDQAPCISHDFKVEPHYLRGTFDSLVFDNYDNMHVLERKTYSTRPTPESLMHHDQMLGYIWILHRMFERNKIGGILYDGLWKRAKPPARRSKSDPPYTISDLFYRQVFLRPLSELQEFETMLTIEANEMAEAIANNRIFINRRWEGCYDCRVSRICDAMSRGEDYEYVKQTYFHKRGEPTLVGVEETE